MLGLLTNACQPLNPVGADNPDFGDPGGAYWGRSCGCWRIFRRAGMLRTCLPGSARFRMGTDVKLAESITGSFVQQYMRPTPVHFGLEKLNDRIHRALHGGDHTSEDSP